MQLKNHISSVREPGFTFLGGYSFGLSGIDNIGKDAGARMDTAISTSSTHTSVTTSRHDTAGARRRQGQTRRRSSSQLVSGNRHASACAPLQLPRFVDSQGSDIQETSPLYALASLRFLVLSYLADLEHRLTQFEFQFDFDFDLELDLESKSKALEAWKLQSEHKFREAKARARTGIEMLKGIRADVCSHFPELPISPSLEGLAKSCLPDVSALSIPEVPTLEDMRSNLPDIRSHLPDIPTLPDMSLPESMRAHLPEVSLSETVRAHLPDMHMPALPDLHIRDLHTGMDDVLSEMRHKLSEVDFRQPFKYIPTLSQSLENLHYHLSSMSSTDPQAPSGLPKSLTFEFPPNNILLEFLESLLKSDIVKEVLDSAPEVIEEGEEILERTAVEVADALKRSLHGTKLINYSELPHPWRNNPFVTYGYRFIPLEQWPLLIKSLFAWHNETLNIHTHLLPSLFWFLSLLPLSTVHSFTYDTPELLFMSFALLCLLCSSVWHTMSGCAHRRRMDICARVDYVGIGWLISATVATVVHYGMDCHPKMKIAFLGLCLSTGVVGSIFPFVKWFNQFEYRLYRIAFFVALAFSGVGPAAATSMLHSPREVISFLLPMFPSLASYVVGLIFYASHFPERLLPEEQRRKLDMYGCGSHAIWHCCIVLAVYQHKAAMPLLKNGLQCVHS